MMKITCQELADLLMDFVANELPAEHRAVVEEHLCSCQGCHVYVETYQITIQLTRRLQCQPLPDRLAQKLRAALEEMRNQEDT